MITAEIKNKCAQSVTSTSSDGRICSNVSYSDNGDGSNTDCNIVVMKDVVPLLMLTLLSVMIQMVKTMRILVAPMNLVMIMILLRVLKTMITRSKTRQYSYQHT